MTEARSSESRLRILRAAAAIAAESGYEATTISKITKRSGLPVSSVYWFFKDKDELLAEVVRHSFEQWLADQPTWDPLPPNVSVTDGLRAILSQSVRTLADAPDFLRIGHMLTLEARDREAAGRRVFLEIREDVERTITDWFAGELKARVVEQRPGLPQQLARIVIASTDGLFLAHQIDDVWDPDEFVSLIVDIVEAAISEAD